MDDWQFRLLELMDLQLWDEVWELPPLAIDAPLDVRVDWLEENNHPYAALFRECLRRMRSWEPKVGERYRCSLQGRKRWRLEACIVVAVHSENRTVTVRCARHPNKKPYPPIPWEHLELPCAWKRPTGSHHLQRHLEEPDPEEEAA